LPGFELAGEDKPFFKEFVIRGPRSVSEINKRLLEEWCIVGGYDLGENCMLLCVTEMNTKDEIDCLVAALQEAGS